MGSSHSTMQEAPSSIRCSLRLSSKKFDQESATDAKPQQRQSIPELPLDIMVNIISRLPVTLIMRCMSLSKSINNLISDPSYSFDLTNYSCILLPDEPEPPSLYLLEFDPRDIYNSSNSMASEVAIFKLGKLPGSMTYRTRFSMRGHCNGLLCLLKNRSGLHNIFVINPILGQFIRLPQPAVYKNIRGVAPAVYKNIRGVAPAVYKNIRGVAPAFAYGIGHSQLTNRYKVLRIIRDVSDSEIFTIGSDEKWRDVNVPYNMKYLAPAFNPHYRMVSHLSALHWLVLLEPNFGGSMCICAFDVTDEKMAATLPLPPEVAVASHPFRACLTVLLEKLCVWKDIRMDEDYELWVMDEYGVEHSWTKKFVVKLHNIRNASMMPPLTISADGVIMITDGCRVIAYDTKKGICLRVHIVRITSTHMMENINHAIPFVPCFVSLVQGS